MTVHGRRSRFKHKAAIKSIPAGSDATARTMVIPKLACSSVYPLDGKEKERAQMASIVKAMGVFTAVPVLAITPAHRFVTSGIDYRIHNVVKHPENDPLFLEIFLEQETA